MRQLIPAPAGPGDPGPDRLADLYAYPGPGRPWTRANMVASADGAASLRGRSKGLSGDADRRVFALLRSLADVILVGAQTARTEGYRPVSRAEIPAGPRAGRPATPPIAVVSRRLDLDPRAPLFTAAPPDARTIVITTTLAPEPRRADMARHADVIVAGAETVDFRAAVDTLAARGHRRLLAEGGPHLLGELARAGLLDELCLTISPLLAGPGTSRIVARLGLEDGGQADGPLVLDLGHVLEDDGFLLCRYTVCPAGR